MTAIPVLPPSPDGYDIVPAADPDLDEALVAGTLQYYRDLVISEIRAVIASKRFRKTLSARLAEYPLRMSKGLRPSLCLATCRAFGGGLADALPSAVALELRGAPTIHEKYGVAIAINVGDALSVLTMTPLPQNLQVIGLQRALRVFREIEPMGRQSVDRQAMELEWVKNRTRNLTDRHHQIMTTKKTCWYACITPFRIGALIKLLERISGHERERVIAIFSKDRSEKTVGDVEYVLYLMHEHGWQFIDRTIDYVIRRDI